MSSNVENTSPIVNLNVGGTKFSTSRETLTWISDSFFSSLLSGRIPSYKDENGAIFIDRDPKYFGIILAFLRTRELDVQDVDLDSLKREAEFYGISPIVSRLSVCTELNRSGCGTDLFHGIIDCPNFPSSSSDANTNKSDNVKNKLTVNSESSELVPDTRKVLIITGHNSWIAIAYTHSVFCYKMKENFGWQQVFSSTYLESVIERIAINAKVQGMAPDTKTRMVAVGFENKIRLWSFQDENNSSEIGTFNLRSPVDSLFFIGSQLVATSRQGHVGVWNAVSQHWQAQDVVPITSYDTAGSFLLLGGQNGGIYYIDMQKFPLRLKDNDLLITELYRDTSNEAITALSVYLTPKTGVSVGNWIEVAYGTESGAVRVIVQHPELVGQGFQLFQTFTVHRSPVTRVMLSEKFLVSVCADNNHVRTWNVTRFRGMISTQPGSTPVASFKVLAIEAEGDIGCTNMANDIGPHGEREEKQVFIQKVVPVSMELYVRLSSTGKRIATIKSVDDSIITCFCLHECDGSTRMGSRPRRYLFTGHSNGNIQIWDMTTALEKSSSLNTFKGGPTEYELLQLLNHCDLSTSSHNSSSINLTTSALDRVLLRSSNTSLDSFTSGSSNVNIRRSSPLSSYRKKDQNKSSLIVSQGKTVPVSKSLSMYENLSSINSLSGNSNIPSTSFSSNKNEHENASPNSPVGGVPLPGMILASEKSEQIKPQLSLKIKKDVSSNVTNGKTKKKQHARSCSLTEHCIENVNASSSIKRQFSLKNEKMNKNFSNEQPVCKSTLQPAKKKATVEDRSVYDSSKHSVIHEDCSLTPRKSVTRNSYKSAMQKDSLDSPIQGRKTGESVTVKLPADSDKTPNCN